MTLKECYAYLEGDYEDILKRIPKETSVLKYLNKYAECDELEKMVEAADKKDYDTVFETSHNLKGMSANLSLLAISRNLSDICESVRDKAPADNFNAMLEEAKEHQKKLREVLKEVSI